MQVGDEVRATSTTARPRNRDRGDRRRRHAARRHERGAAVESASPRLPHSISQARSGQTVLSCLASRRRRGSDCRSDLTPVIISTRAIDAIAPVAVVLFAGARRCGRWSRRRRRSDRRTQQATGVRRTTRLARDLEGCRSRRHSKPRATARCWPSHAATSSRENPRAAPGRVSRWSTWASRNRRVFSGEID